MPELPEVETITSNLKRGTAGAPSLIGQTILSAHILWQKTLAEPDPETFQAILQGQTIQNIGRRAKYITINLTESILVIHLRMSGDLRVEPTQSPLNKHDRLTLDFDSGWRLSFNDTRKFGRVWLVRDTQNLFSSLGPEPDDSALTPERFHEMLKKRSRAIKPLLLDQHFLAGLGNIYTDESLFRANLHPLRSSDTLTLQDAAKLLESIRATWPSGSKTTAPASTGSTAEETFRTIFRSTNKPAAPAQPAGNQSKKPPVAQRGTHFCPHCQPLKGA